ncbi:MAG TPA: hypothetical protein VHP83_24330 [Aggregatilineaceae bacterium]|nr:hypothetical protein [Aggregatilineaceae bacterium]
MKLKYAKLNWLLTAFIFIGITLLLSNSVELRSVMGASDDPVTLFQMAESGQAEAALDIVSASAAQIGGWGAAPGDEIVFDPSLARGIRASILVIDLPPGECSLPKLARNRQECVDDYTAKQNQIRFGRSMFSTADEQGNRQPRPVFDDLLSTYIEEMGHSWQEYLYETEGRGVGPRNILTSWEEGNYWAHGWEYQVKMYVLSLDGRWLFLSVAERTELKSNICTGYANTEHYYIPAYSAPPGWPNPEGWPTTKPSSEALQDFCE